MSGVEAITAGQDDFLVFGGGAGSSAVTQYNLNTKAWAAQKPLSHVTTNLCSAGCLGYAFFATGDFKKLGAATGEAATGEADFKPSDRQIQRYNLTNGQMEENNMEKTRAGATCACYDYAGGATTNCLPRAAPRRAAPRRSLVGLVRSTRCRASLSRTIARASHSEVQ
jgi:hypothetical protein